MNAETRDYTLTVQIAGAVLTSGCAVITYRSEWNGFDAVMPMDHWLECDGQRIDLSKLGSAWSEEDLSRLEEKGALLRLREWTNPDDKFETARWYLTKVVPRDSFDEAVALLQSAHALLSESANALAGSRWGSLSEFESEIAHMIGDLRSRRTVQLAKWADLNGDFVRVGTSSGWRASALKIADLMRVAATAMAAKMLPGAALAPNGGASQHAQEPVGDQLRNAEQSVASVHRDMWIFRLLVADLVFHLVLFAALIGLPPNPVNSLVQDWLLERSSPRGGFGTIDTATIFWSSLLAVLVLFFGQLALLLGVQWAVRRYRRKSEVAAALPPAPSPYDSAQAGSGPNDREMPGRALAPTERQPATDVAERAWGYCERRVALAVAIVTPAIVGILLVTDSVDITSASSSESVATFAPQRAPLATLPKHVNLRVTERRAW